MMRYLAAVVGLTAISMLGLGCGKQAEEQPAGSGAPPQVSSPEQTTAPNAPPPPAASGDTDSLPMNASPAGPATDASAASSGGGTAAAASQTAAGDEAEEGDEEVRPARVAGALFRAIRSSVPIPKNLGGTGNTAPGNGEEAPAFKP